MQLKNYLYYKKEPPQMYLVTQHENTEPPPPPEGFTTAFPMLDRIAVKPNEEIGYQLVCLSPIESKILPAIEEKLTGQVMMSKKTNWTMFSLKPPPKEKYVHIQYIVSEPNLSQKRQSVLALEWNSDMNSEQLAALPGFAHTQEEQGENQVMATTQSVSLQCSTEEFYQSHLEDDMIYQMGPGQRKGQVLVMNNTFLGQGMGRGGSEVDLMNMMSLWSELGFEVHSETNLNATGMMQAIKNFARGATRVSCVVVIIMTHGEKRDGMEFFTAEDRNVIPLDDVINVFTSDISPHLNGIPKLFMFQMCRGSEGYHLHDISRSGESDSAVEITASTDCGVEIDGPMRNITPGRSDMLIAYPSESGHVAYRNPKTGSHLIYAITIVFRKHAHDTHIMDMLTMVNSAIAKKGGGIAVQISNQESYLRKKLYLFPGWP